MAYPIVGGSLPASTLIVCSRNRPRLLLETVSCVLAGDDLPAELMVIDQSDRCHPTLARQTARGGCALHYHWSQSVGVARARNEGVTLAAHDVLTFLDDDMYVSPRWYGALIRALATAGQRGVVTGQVRPGASYERNGFVPSTTDDAEAKVYAGRVGRDVLFTGNMAIYRAAFEVVGRFDERLGPGSAFPSAEDNDLGFRLLEAGYRIHYVPDAVVYHRAWRSAREYIPLYWGYGRGQGAYYAKHLRWRDRYMLRRMGRDLTGYVVESGHYLLRRQPRRACGNLAAALGIITGACAWTVARRAANGHG